VPDTALHGCFAENVPDRLAECFRDNLWLRLASG
jgi:hypothetical protein